ncbi:hypothetical protein KIN20_022019 [Parelaphostrongylus tenuis]|uniref:39S ribosomal protein L46, mitochondrial n=1 Tax=Parelaphostrongylus tenuis TaxID=148309 RepID=A0AAD5N5T5_PARTN|nr:hypothetical protein KIN20_022019 [Parelaphostrongylus tenuis]
MFTFKINILYRIRLFYAWEEPPQVHSISRFFRLYIISIVAMRLSHILYNNWDVMVSVALSRSQVLAPVMSDVERRFHNLQMEEEREKSLLCNFELKSIQDEKLMAKREEFERLGKDLSELEEQIGATNAAIQDGWSRRGEQLMAKLQVASDSARKVNDEHSLQRMLDRKVLLIVQQRFNQEGYRSPWILPQTKHASGESLRETAERCLKQTADRLKASIYGNAPFAVFTQRYPKPLGSRLAKEGAKLFFYHAVVTPDSTFSPNKEEIVEYKWVTREEFWSIVPSKKYKACVDTVFLE